MRPLSPEAVMDKARSNLLEHKGDPSNRKHLLGFFEIHFGVFRGQTFKWVLENALGYAAYLVAAMRRDPTGGSKDSTDHAHNKQCFREYVELFPSGNIAVAMKEEQYVEKKSQQTVTTQQSSIQSKGSQPSPKKCSSVASLSSLLVRKGEQNLTQMVKRLVSPMKVRPSLTHARTQPSSTISGPTASTPPTSVPSSSFVEETPSTSAVPGPSSAPGRSSSAPGKPVSEPDDITLLAEVLTLLLSSFSVYTLCPPGQNDPSSLNPQYKQLN
ncbi:putative protein TPRXL [Gouania willdenowi]|uniref:putative protein TPRXL n=1 Tax=Gouania willdenowi TaxID=441366 RepID=UPI001055EA2D|nr:putative protein TPRXL [Gouania willdenowi]